MEGMMEWDGSSELGSADLGTARALLFIADAALKAGVHEVWCSSDLGRGVWARKVSKTLVLRVKDREFFVHYFDGHFTVESVVLGISETSRDLNLMETLPVVWAMVTALS